MSCQRLRQGHDVTQILLNLFLRQLLIVLELTYIVYSLSSAFEKKEFFSEQAVLRNGKEEIQKKAVTNCV